MKWLLKLVCEHNRIELARAHAAVCIERHNKTAWIDIHGCHNFFVCSDCKATLTPGRRIFPEDLYPKKAGT